MISTETRGCGSDAGDVCKLPNRRLPDLPGPPEVVLGLHVHPHSSGEVPKAAARRRAMAAEIPALPFSTRDRVTRVTRRCAAARDTAVFPRYSRSTRPGWGGLCMRKGEPLVLAC